MIMSLEAVVWDDFFEKTRMVMMAAPKYVQFSDHGIAPGAAEHFHIYAGT